MSALFLNHESVKAERGMEALLRMKKIDIVELQRGMAEKPGRAPILVVHRVRYVFVN